jgi:hypothetical protein
MSGRSSGAAHFAVPDEPPKYYKIREKINSWNVSDR